MVNDPGVGSARIHVMPVGLANKIAAGEVVARPASVLKELMENAIDAGAQSIDVEIKEAGSRLILVRDDGTGMSPDDAVLCFSRHATSKLRSVEELDQIWTLGFRGEALASIAAVSQVTLKTRRKADPKGHLVRIHGGKVKTSEPCAAAIGTVVYVRNVFYNVPARRAFLKSPATELSHLTDVFLAQALANPPMAFSFMHDGKVLHRLAACADADQVPALRARIGQVYGARYGEGLIQVLEETEYLSAYGLVCRPEAVRRSRREQFLYVNSRFVRSASLQHAITASYKDMIPPNRYPFYALFLTLDPRHVDVNVHPAKTEVRFDNDRGAYAFLRTVVRKALGTSALIPRFDPSALGKPQPRDGSMGDRSAFVRTGSEHAGRGDAMPGQLTRALYAPAAADRTHVAKGDFSVQLWQLHGTYICTPLRTGLMVLDQRAAHERILYERALRSMEGTAKGSQQTLFPESVELDAPDMALFDELHPLLQSLGFHVDQYSGRTLVVRGIPEGFRVGTEKYFLRDILAAFKDNAAQSPRCPRENLARSVARSGAIKAGTTMVPEEMRTLIDELFQCREPYTAPSGRPTLIKISKEELKRRFSKVPS